MINGYSDVEILQKIRLGIPSNSQVVGWLYDSIRPMIYSIALTTGISNEEDIQDLIQDVIEAFYSQVMEDEFRAESSIRSYIYSIAKNKCVDRLRKSKETLYDPIDLPEKGEEIDEDSPEALVILTEKTQLLQSYLALLPTKCQQTLQLHFSPQNLSQEEIAKELGLGSAQAVATAVYRCKKKLAHIIINNPILLGRLMDSFNDPFGVVQALIKYADDFNLILAYCRGEKLSEEGCQTMQRQLEEDQALRDLVDFLRSRI